MKAIRVVLMLSMILAASLRARSDTLCPAGTRPICMVCDSVVPGLETPGACERIAQWLAGALTGIGYCLETAPDTQQASILTIRITAAPDTFDSAIVILEQAADTVSAVFAVRLTELARGETDQESFEALLASKIIENLRASYVCHFSVVSRPDSVLVRASSGLETLTPFEWVLPLGSLGIHASRDGYLPVRRDIELDQPGYHTYHLELRKRRFYHSRFMIPALAFAVVSAVGYALDRYYYAEYLTLGENDYYRNPEQFESTYSAAQACERVSQVGLALAGVCLGLSFRF